MQKLKKPVSILLVFMMIVSLFAAVPMTVNAAPPGGDGPGGIGTEIEIKPGAVGDSLVGRYVETPGRGASNTMVFPDCDVYITGVTGTQTIHNTSVTYSHTTEGSYDVLRFNGKEVYRGDWAVPDGIRIVSGSGTSSDPYVTAWYSTPTITWKLDEDTVIDTTKVPFDVVPTHAAPTKEPDEEYTYTFAGWSPEPVAVTDNATYTATFTAVPRPYNVNVETAEHGTVTANPAEAAKGKQVTLTAEPGAGYALSSIKAFKKNTNSQQATLTALDGSSTGGEGYDKLVDGNTNTKWGFNGGSGYIIVKADKAFILNDYSLTTANDTNNYSGRNWKNWEIYGANFASDSEAVKNSDQWQLVTSVTNDSKLQATNFTRYDYSVNADPEAYQYYKIEISANKGDGYTQMSELTLSGANYDVEVVLMQDSADPAKYTFEMPASNVTVKAEFEEAPKYTVTWKDEDGTTLETDNNVAEGTTPTYNGTTPTKAEDANNTYTFSGWKVGETTYALNEALPPVTGDVTYTATFTEAKKLITGQSITLDGNIGINFYLDPAAAGLTVEQVKEDKLSYTFAWADDVSAKVNVAEQSGSSFVPDGDLIKVTCKVCAAEMTCGVKATFNLNGKTESKTYSVREYADTILKDGTKSQELKDLIKAMLNYGAMAQTKFKVNTGKLANDGVAYNPGDVTDAKLDDAIAAANGTDKAANLNDVAARHGAKWYSTSLIYLDNNTIRHYFVKANDAFNTSDYPASKADYYYYVQKTDIPAAELDNLQTFTVGSESFKYSALDFVKGMINSSAADGESKNLAKALYWYNQAANAYFPAPAPVHVHTPGAAVQENVVPASCSATGSYDEVVYCSECHEELSREQKTIDKLAHTPGTAVQENVVPATCKATGSYDEVTYCSECHEELSREAKAIDMLAHTIVAVAEVPATTEADGVAAHYECSVCGKLFTDADGKNETTAEELVIPMLKILVLDGVTKDTTVEDGYTITGTLKGDYKISIADGATVTLKDVNITCLSNDKATVNFAGITPLGDATILLEGTNTVKGGYENYPGVFVPVGKTLTIDGTGSLNASSNGYGCGIGGGCEIQAGNIVINGGNIVINGGTIIATGGKDAAGIGSGGNCSCGNITITGGTITANGGENAAGIGSGYDDATCGNILITGGTVTATGGNYAAGIGSGPKGNCGNITITDTVTQVTATKVSPLSETIGKGFGGSCGTVTIGGEVKGRITNSPFIYQP